LQTSFLGAGDFGTFEASRAARHDENRTDLPDKWRDLSQRRAFVIAGRAAEIMTIRTTSVIPIPGLRFSIGP
jgi:hypothetical protein